MTQGTSDRLEYFQNLKNDWPVIKVQLKEQFDELTEADLAYEEGREEELLQRLEKRLGKSREEVERILQDIYLNAPKGGSPKPGKSKKMSYKANNK